MSLKHLFSSPVPAFCLKHLTLLSSHETRLCSFMGEKKKKGLGVAVFFCMHQFSVCFVSFFEDQNPISLETCWTTHLVGKPGFPCPNPQAFFLVSFPISQQFDQVCTNFCQTEKHTSNSHGNKNLSHQHEALALLIH